MCSGLEKEKFGRVIVSKLFLVENYKSVPLPSFILAKFILTSQIMCK